MIDISSRVILAHEAGRQPRAGGKTIMNSQTAAGIVLCGGQSSRMGRPKAWLPFAGEIMLCRVLRLLGEVPLSPIVVVAAPDQDLPTLPQKVDVVRDSQRGRGPLQGLAGGLAALA